MHKLGTFLTVSRIVELLWFLLTAFAYLPIQCVFLSTPDQCAFDETISTKLSLLWLVVR